MADCSYSRCVQERRTIRRELQKWTKNMVYIVGLERIAEELMGRRKWKLYQESMSRNQQLLHPINNNVDKAKLGKDIEEQERFKDWSPQSKCYFCVDGKLDSDHITHGALSPHQSDSESSDSPSDSEAPPTLTPPSSGLQVSHNNNHSPGPGGMATIESVSSMASLAAVAALAGGVSGQSRVPFYPPGLLTPAWYLGDLTRSYQQERMDVDKSGGGSVAAAATEQPLDLSKPGNSTAAVAAAAAAAGLEHRLPHGMRLPGLDGKHIYKAKPRMSAVAGRRTYTEEELQAALRDIQSGKLGTRRAAVIYGIPRSTLRNKVYKMALERERETHVASAVPLKMEEDECMDDDKELSGAEEEKEVEKALQGPLLSMADILRFSTLETPDALRTLLLQHRAAVVAAAKEGPDPWAGLEHSSLGPYIQNLLMASQFAGGHKTDGELMPMLPELMRKMIAEEQHLNNGDSLAHLHGAAGVAGPQLSPIHSVKSDRIKATASDSVSDMETDDSPSNVILKIPSFRPTGGKNGGEPYLGGVGPGAGAASSSPPLTSESSSPPVVPPQASGGKPFTLRDAIAKNISQKFQQSPEPLKMHSAEMEYKHRAPGYTPPLAAAMQAIKNHHHHHQQQQQDSSPVMQNARPFQQQQQHQQHGHPASIAGGAKQPSGGGGGSQQNQQQQQQGGKGTRPKRGKYRNYDRDSLVEAVRAVQRGEMSVHRAGSYYGVPHSTLEYKVKERHLMRPRKRDPKPNPVDEKIASLKSQDLRAAAAAQADGKLKGAPVGSGGAPLGKGAPGPPQQKYPPGGAGPGATSNGIKLSGMFEPTLPLGYTAPFPFWPHPTYPHMPLDYPHNPSTSQFPANHEQFFASQMMQRLQEESARAGVQVSGPAAAAAAAAAVAAGSAGTGNPAALAKSAREMAESLYDGSGVNGSFLDGIIRSSLESGVSVSTTDKAAGKEDKNAAPENMSNKALLDQLCRNSRIAPLPMAVSSESGGRDGSCSPPLNFATTTRNQQQDQETTDTIELSNDSSDTSAAAMVKDEQQQRQESVKSNGSASSTAQSPPSRIYVKPQFQELTKPENLKPEVLVRFRERSVPPPLQPDELVERNGIMSDASVASSACDKLNMAQD